MSDTRGIVVCFINGTGGSGKDTFVRLVKKHMEEHINVTRSERNKRRYGVVNYSTIDYERDILDIVANHYPEVKKSCDKKDNNYRDCLSHMKQTLDSVYNTSMTMFFEFYIKLCRETLVKNNMLLFVHCREPENIEKMTKAIRSVYGDYTYPLPGLHAVTTTILIDGRTNPEDFTNESDQSVNDYNYDFVIDNSTTLEALDVKALAWLRTNIEEDQLLSGYNSQNH